MLHTIQAGRGFAALAVAAYHLSILLGEPRYLGQEVFHGFTWRGNLGVGFFFVLSGFIIMFAHSKDVGRPKHLKSYALKRFTRIYPVYWTYTAAFCILVLLGYGTVITLPVKAIDWASIASLIRFTSVPTPLAPAWTLFHEVVFYAIFALLILGERVGWFLIALWTAILLILFEMPDYNRPTFTATLLGLNNLYFIFGIAAFYLSRFGSFAICRIAFMSGLVLLVGNYFVELSFGPAKLLIVLYGASFSGIISGLASLELNFKNIKEVSLFTLLGNASYSIYLTHLAFEGLFTKIFIYVSKIIPMTNGILYLVVFSASVTGGVMAYLLFERPLLAFMRNLLLPRTQGQRGKERLAPSNQVPTLQQSG